jgi:hypothetical protein
MLRCQTLMTAHPFLVFMMAMVVSVSYSGYDGHGVLTIV